MEKQVKEKKKTQKSKDDDYMYGAYMVIGVIVLLIVGIILIIFNVLPSNNSGVVKCSSQACFEKQFSLCQPTTWTANDTTDSLTIYYKITGKVGRFCGVQFSNSTEKSVTIACNFDNSGTFFQAQGLAEKNPSAYKCRKL